MFGPHQLTITVYIAASIVFAVVLLYWILYTRRLRTPRNVGTNESIAMASQRKERNHRSGTL
jgi:uncharacterized membrane protein